MVKKLLVSIILTLLSISLTAQQSSGNAWWAVGHHGHTKYTMAEWIAKEEGLKLYAYYDVSGYPTICVGHRLGERNESLTKFKPKTRQECLDLLEQDLERFVHGVDREIAVELHPGQMTALVSLAYNIGLGAFGGSELVRLINGEAPDYLIILEWTDWDKAHIDGRLTIVESILNRRRREAHLFFDAIKKPITMPFITPTNGN